MSRSGNSNRLSLSLTKDQRDKLSYKISCVYGELTAFTKALGLGSRVTMYRYLDGRSRIPYTYANKMFELLNKDPELEFLTLSGNKEPTIESQWEGLLDNYFNSLRETFAGLPEEDVSQLTKKYKAE